jgi:hypothetical protein
MPPLTLSSSQDYYLYTPNRSSANSDTYFAPGNTFNLNLIVTEGDAAKLLTVPLTITPQPLPSSVVPHLVFAGEVSNKVNQQQQTYQSRNSADSINDGVLTLTFSVNSGVTPILGSASISQSSKIYDTDPAQTGYILGLSNTPIGSSLLNKAPDTYTSRGIAPLTLSSSSSLVLYSPFKLSDGSPILTLFITIDNTLYSYTTNITSSSSLALATVAVKPSKPKDTSAKNSDKNSNSNGTNADQAGKTVQEQALLSETAAGSSPSIASVTSLPQWLGQFDPNSVEETLTADLNGDGINDYLLVFKESLSSLLLSQLTPAPNADASAQLAYRAGLIALPSEFITFDALKIRIADVDGDSRIDLFIRESSGSMALYLNNQAGELLKSSALAESAKLAEAEFPVFISISKQHLSKLVTFDQGLNIYDRVEGQLLLTEKVELGLALQDIDALWLETSADGQRSIIVHTDRGSITVPF